MKIFALIFFTCIFLSVFIDGCDIFKKGAWDPIPFGSHHKKIETRKDTLGK
jgi:hypothetical protein